MIRRDDPESTAGAVQTGRLAPVTRLAPGELKESGAELARVLGALVIEASTDIAGRRPYDMVLAVSSSLPFQREHRPVETMRTEWQESS
jgi:hypothetical protein